MNRAELQLPITYAEVPYVTRNKAQSLFQTHSSLTHCHVPVIFATQYEEGNFIVAKNGRAVIKLRLNQRRTKARPLGCESREVPNPSIDPPPWGEGD